MKTCSRNIFFPPYPPQRRADRVSCSNSLTQPEVYTPDSHATSLVHSTCLSVTMHLYHIVPTSNRPPPCKCPPPFLMVHVYNASYLFVSVHTQLHGDGCLLGRLRYLLYSVITITVFAILQESSTILRSKRGYKNWKCSEIRPPCRPQLVVITVCNVHLFHLRIYLSSHMQLCYINDNKRCTCTSITLR